MRVEQISAGGGLVDPSSCRALLSAHQSTVSGWWRVVELDVIDFDDQGDFDLGLHRFVCHKKGTYIACCAVKILNMFNGNTMGCALWLNGAVAGGRVAFVIGGNSSPGAAGTDVFQLVPGDYLELASFHNSVINRDVQGGLIFTNYLAVQQVA